MTLQFVRAVAMPYLSPREIGGFRINRIDLDQWEVRDRGDKRRVLVSSYFCAKREAERLADEEPEVDGGLAA